MTRFRGTLTPPFPPALHAEIGLANLRARELAANDRELHFTFDTDGRVAVELRTVGGRLLGTVPAAVALDIINGADLDDVLRLAKAENDSPPRPPAEA